MIDQATLESIALTYDEYRLICEQLGRTPNEVELGLFGAMWSEHCGYKNSRALLKLLPTRGPHVLQGPGENAGAIDVGDGVAIVFKMESHNHPSAVEPYQGAATGVGGIIRDIFTMGARPIALLDSLRFGPLRDPGPKATPRPRNRYLFEGVVAGIAGYGNPLGVPTVGGEVLFAERYSGNPLVNVMAVGVIEHADLIRSGAKGTGNTLLLVGADTGRDGIHGCSGLASRELSDENEEQRPTVQVGNPFLEKLLIEACLEVRKTDHIVGMQDLGAAGITSAVVEAASKGGSGVEIDVAAVSRRESGMTPYEVMLSESQERMLITVKRGHEAEVQAIFARWGLHSDVIGRVTDDGMVRVLENRRVVAEVPAELLANAPVYRREGRRPSWLAELHAFDVRTLPVPEDGHTAELLTLLAFPDIASKESVFRQYDWSVQTNTVVGPGAADAAVLRLKGTGKAIAVATDCNGRYCYLEPRLGAMISVAEAARNVSCVGAKPLAVTDCLNFGNPEKPEIYYQLEEAILGLRDACEAFGTPVVSGNVSLYNETNGEAIYPTPIVGIVGLLEDAVRHVRSGFRDHGDVIVLLGDGEADLGATAWLEACHGVVAGKPPSLDLDFEARVQAVCRDAIAAGLVRSAHDCSDGGLAICLAECCMQGNIGAVVEAPSNVVDAHQRSRWLFNEAQSRIVVSVAESDLPHLRALAADRGVPLRKLGVVEGDRLRIGDWIDAPLASMREAWESLGHEPLP